MTAREFLDTKWEKGVCLIYRHELHTLDHVQGPIMWIHNRVNELLGIPYDHLEVFRPKKEK